MVDITERHLKIPCVLARRYGRGQLALEDEIESACVLTLARASLAWSGEGNLGTWLFFCCDRRARQVASKVRRRHKNPWSLNQTGPLGEGTLAETIPDYRHDDKDDVDLAEEIGVLLQVATPAQAQVIALLSEGNTPADVARLLGKSRQTVDVMLKSIRSKVEARGGCT